MTTRKKKWTDSEDLVIVSYVQESPSNLHRAFRRAAEDLGRTENAIAYRWYNTVRHKNAVFMTIGRRKMNINIKNTLGTSDNSKDVKLSVWNRIKKLFLG